MSFLFCSKFPIKNVNCSHQFQPFLFSHKSLKNLFINKQLINYTEKYDILCQFQFGFRKGHSTPRGGGGGTAIYGLYGYVPLWRVATSASRSSVPEVFWAGSNLVCSQINFFFLLWLFLQLPEDAISTYVLWGSAFKLIKIIAMNQA